MPRVIKHMPNSHYEALSGGLTVEEDGGVKFPHFQGKYRLVGFSTMGVSPPFVQVVVDPR